LILEELYDAYMVHMIDLKCLLLQHVIVRHAPFFVRKYGSLAVWSCQGMENSHHAAKSAYQRHTQYSGGKLKKSPLVQTFQHWYRIIAHRFRNKNTTINAAELEAYKGKLRYLPGVRQV